MKRRLSVYENIRKHWLLFAILLCILTAALHPRLGSKQGPLKTELTVKYGAVSVIFFISGLSLRTDAMYRTFRQVKLHLFIQLFTFVFVPCFTQMFVMALHNVNVNPWILKGLLTVACMPPPVSSAIILTRAARGNETAAIINSIVGSLLGIVLTPLLLLLTLGSTTLVPLVGTIVQLTATVIMPLFLGQTIRKVPFMPPLHNVPLLSNVSQFALLFVIYATFCDTFETPETGLSALDVICAVFSVLLLQMCLIFLSYAFAQHFKCSFKRQDIVAIVFCSTHKSLTLGIPILRIMFHGYSHLSQISLPLLVYHPTQIILGGLLVSQLKEWGRNKKPPV